MNVYEMGRNAGIVWHLLNDNRDWSFDEIKQASGLRDRELGAAIGWLAREGKIETDSNGHSGAETFHAPHYNNYY